jgi:hypothetical protein
MPRRAKPAMRKAHYDLIAEALRTEYLHSACGNEQCDAVFNVAYALADAFIGTNPAFDKERFVVACTKEQ